MRSAASPTARGEVIPDDASVLCMLCTGTATGANLVATINLRMNSSLADARSILKSLATGGDGGDAAVNDDPTNVSEAEADIILNAPLHPFDFMSPFCFVRNGGNRAFAVEREASLTVKEVLPRYPRLGIPQEAAWTLSPPAPTVVVPFNPPVTSSVTAKRRGHGKRSATALPTSAASGFAATQKRLALCVLYVAQGSGQEGIQLERILAERLILQQTAPARDAMTSLSPATRSYGQGYEMRQWCAAVTRWNANVPDLLGRTILQEMAAEGNEAAVRYLVAQPYVRLQEADRQGNTALHLTVLANQSGCVRLLLEAGADPLTMDVEGNTPLHVALLRKRASLVGLLCGKLRATGVDAGTTLRERRNREGLSPIDIFEKLSPTFLELCLDGSLLAVQSLVHHYLFDRTHLTERELGTQRTGLHAAAMNDAHKDVTPFLIAELGVSVFPAKRWRDLLDNRRQTPLHIAAAHGCTANALALMQAYPAFLSHQDITGDTPLMTALKHNHTALVEAMLTHSTPGAIAANAYDHQGMSALHLACGRGLRNVAEALLLHHGASATASATANLVRQDDTSHVNASGMGAGDANTSSQSAGATHTGGSGRIWDAADGDRNVTLVPSSVRPEVVAVALRMQKASGGRRRQRAQKRSLAPATMHALSPSLVSPSFGGGTRGATPLLCALIHAHQQAQLGRDMERPLALIDLLLRCGGLTTAADARDALVFLLTHDCIGLADRIIAFDAPSLAREAAGSSSSTTAATASHLASVVREVRRDNRLLCRLCERVCTSANGGVQAHSIAPIRWCLDRRCCAGVNEADTGLGEGASAGLVGAADAGYARDGGLPLATCARVGNVSAARYLLETAGADPNALSPSFPPGLSPLLIAIHGGHVEVAGLLIRAGARVSSGDGSWSALAAAAVRGLDPVVRGLLGLQTLNPFDVPHALLEVLLADVNAVDADNRAEAIYRRNMAQPVHQSRGSGCARPVQALRDRREAQRRSRCRMCEVLARHMDPTASSLIHPVELLHLSASRGFFSVTRAIAERLLALPSSSMLEIVMFAPAAPSERPLELVEPTMVPIEKCPWKRLLPNPRTGRGGLHKLPTPFMRLVLPNYRGARLQRQLPHRAVQRDVFSYAAAAVAVAATASCATRGATRSPLQTAASSSSPSGSMTPTDVVELVHLLRYELGVKPWPVVDIRGCTSADYAARAGNKALMTFFTASGVAPCRRHDVLLQGHPRGVPLRICSHQAKDIQVAGTRGGRRREVAPVSPLARAVYHGQPHQGNPTAILSASLCSLIEETTDKETRFEANGCLRALVEEYLKQEEVDDLREVEAWMDMVVYSCAAANRLDVLTMLVEDYHCPLTRPATQKQKVKTPTSPLLAAIAQGNTPMVTFLLHAGCNAHEAATPRADMVPYIKVKRAEDKSISPLCLAAWMGDYDVIRLVTSAAPFEEGYFDKMAESAERYGSQTLFDVLDALVRATPRNLPEHKEMLLAGAVRCLADAGHPFLSPLTLREAAAKHLVNTVGALLESYGSQALLADITDGNSLNQVNSLHHFAAHPALCGLLRSLLVMSESDEYGVASRKPTEVARAVVELYAGSTPSAQGSHGDEQKSAGGGDGADAAPQALCPVDWALSHNCADGVAVLLSIGLIGTGRTQCLGKPSLLVAQAQTALQYFQRTAKQYAKGTFTILHSAVALDLDTLLAAVTKEMKTLAPVSDTVLSAARRAAADALAAAGGCMIGSSLKDKEGSLVAPALYAVAAQDPARWHRALPRLESIERGAIPFSASDVFAVVFGGMGVTRALDAVLRLPCNAKLFAATFTIQDPEFNSAVLARHLQPRHRGGGAPRGSALACQTGLFLEGGRYMLTGFTPLTCAIAAGSLEWVQYFTAVNPAALVYHRATVTELQCARLRAKTTFDLRESKKRRSRKWGSPSHGGDGEGRRHRRTPQPNHVRHHCALDTHHGLSVPLTNKSVGMDALILSAALLADAVASRDVTSITRHTQIFDFLVRVPGAVRKENVNSLAMAAAALRRWPMLETVMEQAMHMRDMPPGERFFFALLPDEVPVALRRLVGPARHVMHLAARAASQDTLIRIARHSSRSDIESSCDGNGRTSLYHALHHRAHPAATVETFAALRIPMGAPCCRKTERTPLMVAASEGKLELVSRLLKAERVNQQDRRGHTALMLAAAHGHLAVVELLLASNADARLCNRSGLTAAMLAACNGHDDVAAPMAQNFSHVKDFANAQTSLLHCAAMGGCGRTAELVCKAMLTNGSGSSSNGRGALSLMCADIDGHTALYVAHAFGSARVLRAIITAYYENKDVPAPSAPRRGETSDGVDTHARMLLDSNAAPQPWSSKEGKARTTITAVLGESEKRILRCDATLPCYGWLRGVLQINDTLVREAARSVAVVQEEVAGSGVAYGEAPLRPGEKVIAPQLPPFRSAGVSKPFSGPLLRWCAVVNNAVGVRVLADMNVADDCGALHVAARFGHMDTVKLLVSLNMSDPSVADEETGLFPFESAAVADHSACASYLLKHTRADVLAAAVMVSVPVPSRKKVYRDAYGDDGAQDDNDDGDNGITRYPHGMLHRLAPACGGAILVQSVEQMLSSTSKVAALCEQLWRLLQRPDEVGLTPFEYTIAMGKPGAVLRCAQLLQQLAEEASRAHGQGVAAVGMESVTIARSLLDYLPNMSPAVRALLFDVFSVEGVSQSVGFDPDPTEAAARRQKRHLLLKQLTKEGEGSTDVADDDNNKAFNDSSAPPLGHTHGATTEDATLPTTHRLSFADVRLLGINALMRDPYCESLVNGIYTIDHERLALRFLMKGFPYRIRYEPETFRTRTLAQQKQLLQWLSTSLVLSAYDGAQPGDVGTIEIHVAPHRSEELFVVHGADTGTIAHSLYVSSSQYLVGPDVRAALTSSRETYKREVERDVARACKRVTRAMRALPHPALREGTVTVDWPMRSSSGSGKDAHTDRLYWDSTVRRVRTALDQVYHFLTGPVGELLRDVTEEDLMAVVASGGKTPAPAALSLRYVASSADADGVVRFPPLSQIRTGVGRRAAGGESLLQCSLVFDRQAITDPAYALEHTIKQAVAADVALVRVHHVRDRFLRRLRATLKAPMEREAAKKQLLQRQQQAAEDSSPNTPVPRLTSSSSPVTPGALVPVDDAAVADVDDSLIQASLVASLSAVKFKLELENSPLAAIPIDKMADMLDAAADVVERLLANSRHPSKPSSPAVHARCFHTSDIVAEAVGRRLRTVLVLFTTKREPLVKFHGDKLMLCFSPHLCPSASDIAREIQDSVIKEETTVCRRLLSDITATLSQRLQSYLPNTRLVLDLATIDNPREDKENVLSSLRLLTYKHSSLVLEPFIEGVCMGWDGPLGACVRRGVRQLTLTLETGERGTCYLTPGGNCVYYCPLQCVQRGGPAVLGSLATLTAWQLLTAQQVASLVLLQLAVTQPEVTTLLDTKRAAACWTSVWRDGRRPVTAGGHGYAFIQQRNLLNRPIRKPETEEQFRFMGKVDKVKVKDLGRGRYRVKYTAPKRAGYTHLHAFLHGQQLFHSPLLLRVRPESVALDRTTTLSTFDAVVATRPFEVLLRLTDGFGNRLERKPSDFELSLKLGTDTGVKLLSWTFKGPDTVAVRLCASQAKSEVLIQIQLTCTTSPHKFRSHAHANEDTATGFMASGLANTEQTTCEATHQLVFQCVEAALYERVTALRKGVAIDALDRRAADHAKLFFRKSIRDAEEARLKREAESIGAAVSRTFAPALSNPKKKARVPAKKKKGASAPKAAL